MAYTLSDNLKAKIEKDKETRQLLWQYGTDETRATKHAVTKNSVTRPSATKVSAGQGSYQISDNLRRKIRETSPKYNQPTQTPQIVGGSDYLDPYKTYIQPPSKSEKGGGVQMTKAYSQKRMQDTATNLWLEYGDKSYSEIMAAVSANDTEDPFMKQYETEVLNYIGSENRTRADIENEIAQTEKEIEIAQAEWDEIANTYVTTEGEGYTKYQDAAKRVDDLTWKKKNLEGELWMWDQGEIYGAIPGYSDYEKNSGVTGDFTNDGKYNFINNIYGAQDKKGQPDYSPGSNAPYGYMTEEQKGIYNYLYNVSGKKAANEYLDYISYDLNKQRQQDIYQNAFDYAAQGGGKAVAGSIASVGSNLISGIGYVDVLGQEFVKRVTGSKAPVDYNRGAQSAYNYTQGIRQGVTNSIDSNIGKKAYNLGMSMADSATIMLLTLGVGSGISGLTGKALSAETLSKIGKAGTMLLSGSAATSMMHDVRAVGGNDGQALALGFVAGAAEYAMENLSLENLFKIGDVATARQFVYSLLKQGGVEATEESLTTLANTAADIIVMGDKNELKRMYNEYVLQGYSHEEAERLAKETWLKGLLEDTAGGFISGLTFGLGGAVAGSVQYRNSDATQKSPYGQAIPELVEESKELGVGGRTADRIQRKLDNGGTVKTKEVNRLVKANEKAFVEADVGAIQKAAEARLIELGETGNVSVIASALAKETAGKKPTRAEGTAFANSKYGERVRNELNPAYIGYGDYSSNWAQKIGTSRVNTKEYNRLADNRSDIEKASDKYGVQAEAMVSTYNAESKDQDVDKYDKAYQVAFDVGKENGNLDALKKTDAVQELTEWQVERAYEAGQAAAKTVELSNVDRIESIKGGKMTIRLSNGNVIDSSDAIYASSGIAGIYSTVGNLGVTAPMANNIIGTLTENTNADVFAKGVEEAFKYGKTGMSMTDLMNNSENAKKLTDKQRNTAYNAGKKVAGEAVARAQAKAEAKKGTRVGKVHYDGNVDGLDGVRKAGYQAAEMAAKMLGTDIYFFESYAKNGGRYYIDANGNEVKAPNGWYDPRDKSIHLDINAGAEGKGIVLFTLAHELTHYIKDGSPRHFKILANTLFDHLGETESVEVLIAKKMEEQNLSHDKAYEEVVADAMETVLNSGNVLNALADIKQQDTGLWNKIKKFFKDFVERLKNIVSTYADERPDSDEGNLVADIEGLIAKLEPIFTEGLAAASENMGENMGDDMTNEEAFTDSSVAIMNQIRPPYTDKSKAFDAFADSLNPEAKKTFDLFYNFYQKSLVTNTLSVRGKVVKKVNISSPYMLAQEWNEMLEKAPKWAATARELAKFLPADVRKRMNMNEDGTLNPSPMEKEFRMPTSLAQRLVDALPYESIDAEYTLGDKTITLPEGKARQSVGGEAYRRAILAETRKLYSEGKLKQVSIGAMSKDKWGSMGFLAANGKTGASGDFTTVCPQMMFNRGCWYCYRRAAMESGVNNKLVAQNVWYTGEILRIKDSVIDDLNHNGGLRIQSFGDWMPHFSAMLADVLYDAELRGLQVKIITKEPSMINYIAALREQGIGENLYFNLSADYTIEKGPAKQATDGESLDTVNPERPYMRGEDRSFWWKRAMTVEEASKYREKYKWVNTRIVAATLEEFIRGLKDPTVDVVTGYHGNIRQYERIDSATGKRVVEVEALGDAGMPRFSYNPVSDSWIVEHEGKTATHKKLAAAIMEENLQLAYYTKSCCITGRCFNCKGKCGALSKEFNIKNATNRDAESVAYWQRHMQYAIEPEFGDMTTDDDGNGISYQQRSTTKADTFYSQMARVVDGVKQEKLGASSVVNMLRGKGVKAEEIKWSGIEQFLEGKKSVTKTELQEFIAGSMLQIEEEVRGGSDEARREFVQAWRNFIDADLDESEILDGLKYIESSLPEHLKYLVDNEGLDQWYADYVLEVAKKAAAEEPGRPAKWKEYSLEGGENYREILFKMPKSEYSNDAMKGHWGDDTEGVIAHARVQDFDTADGKMLFIEEIQSDWHNAGRKYGYASEEHQKLIDEYKAIRAERMPYHDKVRPVVNYASNAIGMDEDDVYHELLNKDWDKIPYFNYLVKYFAEEDIENLKKDVELFKQHKVLREKINAEGSKVGSAPNAPFRDTYHEYVLKRLIREAAEKGYDSLGWTTAQIQSDRWSDAYAEGYRIEYDQDIPKFLNKYGKKWGAKVGKTDIEGNGATEYVGQFGMKWNSIAKWVGYEVTYLSNLMGYDYMDQVTVKQDGNVLKLVDKYGDIEYASVTVVENNIEVWSMPITDAMRKSVMTEGQPLYQQRSTDGLSNRAILANVLSEVAQDDKEASMLKLYTDNVQRLDEQIVRLAVINAEIKQKSFGKGKRDTARLAELKAEQSAIQKEVVKYDKMLLDLETTAPLKRVLERERKKAYDKARAKGREALAAQRKKADEKLEATKKQYQESRKKNVEQRKTTAMRNKVKEVVAELNKYLLHGTKDKHIPIGLQKPVAEALDIINMDTVGAAERIAHYDELIAKFADDPKTVEELTATRERIRNADDKLSQKLSSLKSSYADIKNSDDPLVANAYDEVIASTIDYVVRTVGDTPLRDMTYTQLSDVYDMYKMILTKVRNANKAFAANKKLGITEMSEVVIGELKKFARESDKSTTLQEFFRTQDWNNLKPIYAFERMGSGMLTGLYEDLRMGEDTWIKDAEHAKKFFNDTALKYKYSTWDMDKRYEFTSRTGVKFSVSLQQILSLYAYSKREQADAHLERGGFVFDDSIEVKEKKHGIPVKYTVTTSKAHNLSREILGEILAVLTPDQRAFADEMQTYLSETMGEKGNEVTLQMYGVKLFKEKNYFPLKSAKQFMFEQNETAGEVRVKNSGFTKEVTPHASNPIILSDFIDVWTKHVNDMAMYHSFVLPLEDFTRVFNFKTPASEDMQSESVKSTLENAFGTQATGYINQLLKDINGGVVTDSRENLAKKLTASFKKAAVFASLSVVVQQPSAIGRAFAVINPKYFVGDKVDAKRHKLLWKELKQYAPVAAIKEMGYFDTNMGKSAADFITSQQYIGFKEKAKAVFKDSNYRDELLSKLPALADELTWCAIWDAVKRETRANNPDMKVGSEEFLTLAGQRFTEVIEKTQVYDSVFARSANMRSKSALMGMATSFLAEPTTTINMVFDSVSKFLRGDKKQLPKVAGAVMSSIILNSLLSSLVYAMRDDDEDETYIEKWVSSFTTEMIDGINPLTYLPFVKDVWSILQGYDVERADMSLVSKLYDSMSKVMKVLSKDTDNMDEDELIEHRKNVVNAFLGLGDNLSSVFGLPVKNIRREFSAMFNVFKMTPIKDTTWNSLVDNVGESVKRSIPFVGLLPNKSKQDKLYEAITSGDEDYAERIMGTYETESALNTAIRKALRNNDDRIKAAAEAKMSGNADEYLRIVNEIVAEGFFSQDNVIAAIKSEVNAMTEDKTSGASAAQALFNADDYFNAVVYGDAADAEVVKNELVEASVAKGNTRAQAESSVASGFVTNVKNAYEDGSLDRSSAIEYITKFGGKSRDEAETELKKVDFELEYGFPWSERDNAFRLGDITEPELITAYMDIEGKDRSEAVEAVEKIKFSNEYGFAYEDRKEAYASGIITREELKEVLIVAGGKTEEEAETQIRAYDWQNEGFDVSANSTQFFEDYDTRIAPAGIGKGIYYDAYKFYNAAGEEGVAYSKTTECMPYIDSLPLTAAQKTELARCWWSDRTINKYKLW